MKKKSKSRAAKDFTLKPEEKAYAKRVIAPHLAQLKTLYEFYQQTKVGMPDQVLE